MRQIFLLVTTFFYLTTQSQVNEPVSSRWAKEEFRQFDFWIGEWDVNLRIQQSDGSWKDQVQSTARIYRILDGKAVLELWNENQIGQGIKGYSLRYFNEEKGKWELWLNWPAKNRSGSSSLEGSFRHGRGEFFSEYKKNDSVTITQRYTFCDIAPNSLRWDDAFSEDGGKTWKEGSWIMEFSRKQELAVPLNHTDPALTFDNGNRCDLPEFDFFNEWSGKWSGEMKVKKEGRWMTSEATMNVYRILDGCGVASFVSFGKGNELRSFQLNTYNTYVSKYEITYLDNQSGSNVIMQYGGLDENTLTLLNGSETVKAVWTKDGDQLKWELFQKINNEWGLEKTMTLKQD